MKNKGLTPVIAVVLLMTIAVAATSTAYQFIINAQETAQQGFEEQFSQQQLESRSDLNIQTIYQGPGNDAFMSIRNTGSVKQVIESESGKKYWNLYVNGTPAGSDGTSWSYISGRPAASGELTGTCTVTVPGTPPAQPWCLRVPVRVVPPSYRSGSTHC